MPDVKVVDEPQRGLVQARRAGCLAAEGEYIANIDADTVLAEGWLQTALAEFARFARDEIDSAAVSSDDEDERLRERRDVLANAERIGAALASASAPFITIRCR